MDILGGLNKAISMEEKGYNFYKEASKKVKNPVTKKTFDFLADQEVLHIESIRAFYDSIEKGQKNLIAFEKVSKKRLGDLEIFSKTIDELKNRISPNEDDRKACELAMELENAGYRYYEDMLKETNDSYLIKLLKFLLSEESKHYESIMKLHSYIVDSENWNMYEEGSFPQGG